jgi:hypothetical protein
MTFGTKLPTDWQTKVGVDMHTAPASPIKSSGFLLDPTAPGSQTNIGAGWASVDVPALAAPLSWGKAQIDARVDPLQEQGRIGTTLSRAVPLGSMMSLTLSNSYGLSEALGTPATTGSIATAVATTAVTAQHWDSSRSLRLDLPETLTAFSIGSSFSSADSKWLQSYSAEQKVFGPLTVTGEVKETATGTLDRSIRAGFKKTW